MTTPDNCLDFDRFMAEFRGPDAAEDEAEESPLSIRVLGKDYPLPRELPATFMLAQLRRQRRDGGAARTTEEYVALLDALFGPGTVDKWASEGLKLEDIVLVAVAAEQLINGEAPASLYERARSAGQGGETTGEAEEAAPKKPRRRRNRRR